MILQQFLNVSENSVGNNCRSCKSQILSQEGIRNVAKISLNHKRLCLAKLCG